VSWLRAIGIELPIVQAPMAGVQGSALAAAVSNAGGLGSLPCALLTLEGMRNELDQLAARSTRPVNVNFFCHEAPVTDRARDEAWRAQLAPYYRELDVDVNSVPSGPGRTPFEQDAAALLEAFRPAVVSFHFGLPGRELLERVRMTGARIVSSATTVDEARWLEARGVDAIVAQGFEAGGHRGMFLTDDVNSQIGTFALVPQIVKAVRVPVIAAGGIADAAGVRAALAPSAVQVGTAFLLCPEATTSAVHRSALQSDAARQTAVTNVFTGRPARGIVNRLMREIGPMSSHAPAFPLAAAAIVPLRAAAERRGSGDFSPLWAGQNVTGVSGDSASTLTRRLAGVA
jgi:nitronate monooxygenase